jgi:tRNA pseudouridine13 synthase
MNCLSTESKVGLEIFFTNTKGVGGKLRTIAEDFIVKEIYQYPTADKQGIFSVGEITALNWETNHLIREFSKKLHISRKRISFAGTKDKRALSTRLMSFHNVSIDDLLKINIKDVTINNLYKSNKSVQIGDLVGNKFDIKIRNIENNIKKNEVKNTIDLINKTGGFPNFYGIQRFGIIRPNTHIVGKNIIHGDFEKAAMNYIGNPIKGEDEDVYTLRKELEESRDFSKALESYPSYLSFEKAILNKLIENPDDFVGALMELPKNLLTMFVYAYQSFLFNKILSWRIRNKIPLNKAIEGDIILPLRNNILDQKGIFVTKENIDKVNKQISKGKAFVSGVLFGYDSVISSGDIGEFEHKLIEQEGFVLRDFIVPEIPFISSSGSRRSLLAPVNNLNYVLDKDELNSGKNKLQLKFDLGKGCYATSLLREFMKSNDVRDY